MGRVIKWLGNTPIAVRIFAAPMLGLILFSALLFVSDRQSEHSLQAIDQIHEDANAQRQSVADLVATGFRIHSDVSRHLALSGSGIQESKLDEMRREIAKNLEHMTKLLKDLQAGGLTGSQLVLLKNISAKEQEYAKAVIEMGDMAKLDRLMAIPLMSHVDEEFSQLSGKILAVQKDIVQTAAARTQQTRDASTATRKQFWSIAGVVVLGIIGIVVLIALSLTRPLSALTRTMLELADGKLDAEVAGTEARDEVGAMARALHVFQENARSVEKLKAESDRLQAEAEAARQREERAKIEELRRQQEEEEQARHNAETARRQAEERKREDDERMRLETERQRRQAMNEVAEGFEKAVGHVVASVATAAAQMQSLAEGMVQAVDTTNSRSSTVAAASEQASANVQTVASAARQLSASVSEISRQVQSSSTITTQAVVEANNTNAQMEGLADAAQRIGKIVEMITNIAGQTNLLALNATIEAARAGEAGKGFAVVASEVKNLASETARATAEINTQVGAIQQSTDGAVGAIRAIRGTIEQVNDIANTIAAAVEEQGAATNEIARNVEEASAGTLQVSENIVGVTEMAQQTGTAAAQVLEAAGDLSRQAESLKTEVRTFIDKIRAA